MPWEDDAESAIGLKQGPEDLGEQFVGVEISAAPESVRVSGVSKSDEAVAVLCPCGLQLIFVFALCERHNSNGSKIFSSPNCQEP